MLALRWFLHLIDQAYSQEGMDCQQDLYKHYMKRHAKTCQYWASQLPDEAVRTSTRLLQYSMLKLCLMTCSTA